jgi:hypothetical protein
LVFFSSESRKRAEKQRSREAERSGDRDQNKKPLIEKYVALLVSPKSVISLVLSHLQDSGNLAITTYSQLRALKRWALCLQLF